MSSKLSHEFHFLNQKGRYGGVVRRGSTAPRRTVEQGAGVILGVIVVVTVAAVYHNNLGIF